MQLIHNKYTIESGIKTNVEELQDLYNRACTDWVASYGITQLRKGSRFIASKIDGKLVGSCIVNDGIINCVCVDLEHRNKGIASSIVKEALHCQGCYLQALKDRVSFYTRLGFKVNAVSDSIMGNKIYNMEYRGVK